MAGQFISMIQQIQCNYGNQFSKSGTGLIGSSSNISQYMYKTTKVLVTPKEGGYVFMTVYMFVFLAVCLSVISLIFKRRID